MAAGMSAGRLTLAKEGTTAFQWRLVSFEIASSRSCGNISNRTTGQCALETRFTALLGRPRIRMHCVDSLETIHLGHPLGTDCWGQNISCFSLACAARTKMLFVAYGLLPHSCLAVQYVQSAVRSRTSMRADDAKSVAMTPRCPDGPRDWTVSRSE